MLLICVLGIMELNWYPRFGDKKKIITKLKICLQGLSLSTQLQNRRDETNSEMLFMDAFSRTRKTSAFINMTRHAVSMVT